jgi:uncharacterized membrane protein YdjX (TVP38/TMEM64 family)
MTAGGILRALLLFALLFAAAYLLKATSFGTALDTAWIDAEVRGRGAIGQWVFIVVGALVTAVGVPRQLVAFLGGYAFGFVYGGLLGLLATLFGAALSFTFARFFGQGLMRTRLARRIRALDRFIHDHPFSLTLLVRLLPVGNNLVTNLAAGITRISAWPYFAASAIGFLPQNAVFTLIGSGVSFGSDRQIVLGVALLSASGALGVWLYRRQRRSCRAADVMTVLEAPTLAPPQGRERV